MQMNESIFVMKCGGSTMEQLPDSFFTTLAQLQRDGKQVVIVHGGGPAINAMLTSLQIPAQFMDGLRVTCDETIKVVEMVLTGSINKQLVRRIQQAGGKAWGVSGQDGGMITAVPTTKPLGLVGEINQVDVQVLKTILQTGYIPVVAPLGLTADGKQCLNINADVAAGAIAAALQAEQLLMVTDVPGILVSDEQKEIQLLAETNEAGIKELIAAGEIYGGMIPKVTAALGALKAGVEKVVICRGDAEALQRAGAGKAVGTMIKGVGA